MSKVYIYGLTHPKTGELHYVGKSILPGWRLIQHLQYPHSKVIGQWIESLRQEGLEPEMRILETVEDGADWRARELHWIKQVQSETKLLLNSQRDVALAFRGYSYSQGASLVTVRLSPEVYAQFKLACVKLGRSMSDVLRSAIRHAIWAARQQGGEEEE